MLSYVNSLHFSIHQTEELPLLVGHQIVQPLVLRLPGRLLCTIHRTVFSTMRGRRSRLFIYEYVELPSLGNFLCWDDVFHSRDGLNAIGQVVHGLRAYTVNCNHVLVCQNMILKADCALKGIWNATFSCVSLVSSLIIGISCGTELVGTSIVKA